MKPVKVQNRGYMARKIFEVAGPASMIAKPIAETSYMPLVVHATNTGTGINSICVDSVAAGTTTVEDVAEKTALFGVEFGGVIFGGVTSFICMCTNGYMSMTAYKKYKALGDLLDKVSTYKFNVKQN